MSPERTKTLKELEKENARLKRIVAELIGAAESSAVEERVKSMWFIGSRGAPARSRARTTGTKPAPAARMRPAREGAPV